MINEGKVVAFVNDMLVGIEIEEEYDEIIDKILRKLEKNGLYVKPEKCVWKVQKIEFLGVVIGPNRIEMEKEKVDRIISWPIPKNITRPVLVALNLNKEFRVEVDVSNYVTGDVLSMKCTDELWRPVAFISKSLSDTE